MIIVREWYAEKKIGSKTKESWYKGFFLFGFLPIIIIESAVAYRGS